VAAVSEASTPAATPLPNPSPPQQKKTEGVDSSLLSYNQMMIKVWLPALRKAICLLTARTSCFIAETRIRLSGLLSFLAMQAGLFPCDIIRATLALTGLDWIRILLCFVRPSLRASWHCQGSA